MSEVNKAEARTAELLRALFNDELKKHPSQVLTWAASMELERLDACRAICAMSSGPSALLLSPVPSIGLGRPPRCYEAVEVLEALGKLSDYAGPEAVWSAIDGLGGPSLVRG